MDGVDDAIRFLREYKSAVPRPSARTSWWSAAATPPSTPRARPSGSVRNPSRCLPPHREEMPAYAEEIEEAEHEGVVIKVLTARSRSSPSAAGCVV